MSLSDFFEKYIEFGDQVLPGLSKALIDGKLPREFVSPHVIPLSSRVLQEARKIVQAFHALRMNPNYQKAVFEKAPAIARQDPKNFGVFMCYDFHLTPNGLKLIEINTNAAGAVTAYLLYRYLNHRPNPGENFLNEIRAMFEEEARLAGHPGANQSVAIVDENPLNQKAAFEFLIYRTLLKSWGWSCECEDVRDLQLDPISGRVSGRDLAHVGFIYNRYCDFYLKDEMGQALNHAYAQKRVVVSPNPHEYSLLADKERLIELAQPGFLESLSLPVEAIGAVRGSLEPIEDVMGADPNELWARRKKLFFKPKRSYGSKAVYKGASISRRVFDEILAGDFLAQAYIEAPQIEFETGAGKEKFKYDLRFYTYQDQIQLPVARLYQGQATNFQTPGGGLSAIHWL